MLIYTGVRLQKLICKSAVQALRLLTGLGPQSRSQKSLKLTVYVNKALASSLSYDKLFYWKKDLALCFDYYLQLWALGLSSERRDFPAPVHQILQARRAGSVGCA